MKSINIDNLDIFPKNTTDLREFLLDLPYCVYVKLPNHLPNILSQNYKIRD